MNPQLLAHLSALTAEEQALLQGAPIPPAPPF